MISAPILLSLSLLRSLTLLVCSDTMWGEESYHDVLNPYNHVLELPEYMNGERLEEFKKRVVLTPEQDVPIYLRECLERLSHLFPPREKLEEAIRSILAEAEAEAGQQQAEQGKHEGSCDLCGYQFDAERLEERCFCYHPFY